MPWSHLQAVFFDLDGTLIDSAPDLGRAANAMRVARGMPELDLAEYRPHGGSGARGMLARAFALAPGQEGYDEFRQEFLVRYEGLMFDSTRPFAGIQASLLQLQAQGLNWGIVTNKAERLARPLVQGLALEARVVIGGDTTPHAKPHPAPLFEAARQLGVMPQHCLYVGDDLRDIQAGRAAGMSTAVAAWGYLGAQARPHEWGADIFLNQPADLLKELGLA